MAADFISITSTNRPRHGTGLIRLAELVREARDLCDGLNDAAGHMFDGGDYTVFESKFGVGAGSGANVITLLGLVNNILNTNTTVAGADRLSQLDEFVSRVAGQ